jgi:FAD:protein FMN transferase
LYHTDKKLLLIKIFLFIVLTIYAFSITAQQKRYNFTQPKMGSPFTIIMYCASPQQADTLATQCFNLVDSFNNIFSDYINNSELMQLNTAAGLAPVKISKSLMEILLLSKSAFEKSTGAFDITIGPTVKLWRQARKTNQWPATTDIAAAKNLTGFSKLIMDTNNNTVTLPSAGMGIDLGGIAKGWIAQRVINFLNYRQVESALVDAGGDIVMSKAPPSTLGWSVGINVPESSEQLLPQSLVLQNQAVATSGDVYRYITHKGKKYSHIIDPRTGYGVTFKRNVTIVAADGATADWLATACSILPIGTAKKLATQNKAAILITQYIKGRVVFYSTPHFAQYYK